MDTFGQVNCATCVLFTSVSALSDLHNIYKVLLMIVITTLSSIIAQLDELKILRLWHVRMMLFVNWSIALSIMYLAQVLKSTAWWTEALAIGVGGSCFTFLARKASFRVVMRGVIDRRFKTTSINTTVKRLGTLTADDSLKFDIWYNTAALYVSTTEHSQTQQ